MNWPAFTNPWMLAALAAVGLPILIHYLTRARPRRIIFPPFKFLVEACAGQQSLHRLRTLLLLALRTLAVLALALLFARPFLKPSGAGNTADAAKRVVLLLDASLSMRAVQRGVSLFSRAQAEAANVLRALESGSEAGIIVAGVTPRPLLPALSRNIPALHDELVKAHATFEQGDPASALAMAKKMLGGSGVIYVFSDFQKSNWEAAELPAGTLCRLRPVTREPIDNIALTSAYLAPAEPVVGEPSEVICTVFNGTARPRQETVHLELGEMTQEALVTVPPFGSTDASFNIAFPQPGPLAGKATLGPDDLMEDNVRYLNVRVNKALQALLITDSDATDQRSAAFFISRALAPSAEAAPGLTVVRRHSQDADRGVLETADVFVLVAPAALTGESLEIIERRVKDGARFIAFLDGSTAPFLVPAAFAPPFRLLGTVVSDAGEQLVAGPRKLFIEGDASDFSALRFRRHYQNQILEGRGGDVVLSYPDGSAALTLSAVAKGSAAFVNLPLTPDGGDFIGHPMFPALIHEVLRALRRGAEEHVVTPGMAWTLDAPVGAEGAIGVSDPEGRKIEAQVVASGRTTRLALPAAHLPGVYLVKQAERVVATAVVNIDPRESDTRPVPLESLKSGEGAAVTTVRDEEDLLLTGKTRPLWPELAGAAAFILALEMLLLALWRRPAKLIGSQQHHETRTPAQNDQSLGASTASKATFEEIGR